MIGTNPGRSWALAALSLVILGGVRTRALNAQNPRAPAVVRGQVIEHESGNPLPEALVTFEPRPGEAGETVRGTTGREGEFLLEEVTPGLYDLRVTLLGYHDLQDTLRVLPQSSLDLTLPLSVSPIPLEPIVVVSTRQPPGPMRGFEARRRMANGVFLSREDIQTAGAHRFTDLIRRVPGARVIPMPGYGNRVVFRGGCRPDLWVDGVLANTTADLDSFLRPGELEGVEVYKGAALPMEFGSNLCGAIVVWTAPGRRTAEGGESGRSFWKRLAVGAGLLLLAFLATR